MHHYRPPKRPRGRAERPADERLADIKNVWAFRPVSNPDVLDGVAEDIQATLARTGIDTWGLSNNYHYTKIELPAINQVEFRGGIDRATTMSEILKGDDCGRIKVLAAGFTRINRRNKLGGVVALELDSPELLASYEELEQTITGGHAIEPLNHKPHISLFDVNYSRVKPRYIDEALGGLEPGILDLELDPVSVGYTIKRNGRQRVI